MKLPEFMFVIINPIVRLWMHSPLHGLLSGSVMLITFTGRKSGKTYTTPVRYMQDGDTVRCSTSREFIWWRNLRGGAEVKLRIAGKDGRFQAETIEDPSRVEAYLREFLGAFPQDAPYLGVEMDKNRRPLPGELERVSREMVLIESRRVASDVML
jgi:deazaflavin-dependent oxidoreductase (nitroreductase family)